MLIVNTEIKVYYLHQMKGKAIALKDLHFAQLPETCVIESR